MEGILIEVVALAVVAAFGALMGWYNVRAGRLNAARVDAWTDASRALGLRYLEGDGRTLIGKLDGFDVVFETYQEGSGRSAHQVTEAVLGGRGRIRPEIALKAESGWEGVRRAFGKEDVQLEEADFDRVVNVEGPEDATLASLDAEARKLVAAFVARGGEVRGGELRWKWDREVRSSDEMQAHLRTLALVAKALSVDSVPAALLENATGEPNPKLRQRNLAALVSGHGATDEARRAVEAGLADADPGVRLLAARHAEATDAVRAVLERLVEDEGAGGQVRAGALGRLAEAFPYAALAARIPRWLGHEDEALRCAAVRLVGQARDVAQRDLLASLVFGAGEALGESLARALSALGGAEAETALLSLLAHDSPKVARAAAEGLGAIGTVRAVEPLLPLTQGVLGDGAVKEAARDAVRAIQARLGDAGGGRLSVVEAVDAEGGLSVDARDGKVRG